MAPRIETETSFSICGLTSVDLRMLDLALSHATDRLTEVFCNRQDLTDSCRELHQTVLYKLGGE